MAEDPVSIQINAWDKGPVHGAMWKAVDVLQAEEPFPSPDGRIDLAAPDLPDDRRWSDPRVGWGLVVPDDQAMSGPAKARGEDVPGVLVELCRARKGSLLRHVSGAPGYLRRYYDNGQPPADFDAALATRGLGDDAVPKYLLLYGTPAQIPWRTQYALNMSSYVGRLDLEGEALERYVAALTGEWAGDTAEAEDPLVWSVDFGAADITHLMQGVVADPIWARLQSFQNQGLRFAGAAATIANLVTGVAEGKPALIITTSHGKTGPLDDAALLRSQLGGLVDAREKTLLASHFPEGAGGAIWYAHACCSAGSDASSQLEGLFPPGHAIGDLLRGVSAAAGSMTAPLPSALLGATRPLRAFVGHVEPTFDCTLQDPFTRQVVSHVLEQCLCDCLYQADPWPIGYAMSKLWEQAGAMITLFLNAKQGAAGGNAGALTLAAYRKIAALDRQSLVILGDPTVTLPIPKGPR